MAQRQQLHELLTAIMAGGAVYFQAPPTTGMTYPCIVYKRDNTDAKYADNKAYLRKKRYAVTVIDRNPDSEIPDKVAELPLTRHSRFFVANNLNHDVFDVYF